MWPTTSCRQLVNGEVRSGLRFQVIEFDGRKAMLSPALISFSFAPPMDAITRPSCTMRTIGRKMVCAVVGSRVEPACGLNELSKAGSDCVHIIRNALSRANRIPRSVKLPPNALTKCIKRGEPEARLVG